MSTKYDVGNISLKPKRHHGYAVLLFILGTLFPPLAVAARFGIGSDFWLNLFLTICGYIPGHVHNFYIQNIRNNKNNRRTPKWAQRYGLVDTTTIKRHQKRSQWAQRYNERNPQSTLENQPYEAGQGAASSVSVSTESANVRRAPSNGGELWSPDDERYYNNNDSGSVQSSSRWHYPANFEDTIAPSGTLKKKKKDRWARTEDAYSINEDSQRKRRKKKRSSRQAPDDDTYSRRTASTTDIPENPEGTTYGRAQNGDNAATNGRTDETQIFNHEF
ncbi:hypothetical protein OF83DRAFT_663484 [Amylostereum chailletii]|nr:hypothetical protein OF83DRAFT_663484 [Amylostereum chailletii]